MSLQRRQRGTRDARLFIVATEGAKAEPAYFAHLRQLRIVGPRVHIEVVPTPTVGVDAGRSAPEYVLNRAIVASKDLAFRADLDEIWLVLDVDRWGAQLSQMASVARTKQVQLAATNPCFEFWLLLHFAHSAPIAKCDDAKVALVSFQPVLDALATAHVDRACTSARQLDPGRGNRWPQATGSDLYRLFDALRDAGAFAGVERVG